MSRKFWICVVGRGLLVAAAAAGLGRMFQAWLGGEMLLALANGVYVCW